MIAYENGCPSDDLLQLQAVHKMMLAKFSQYCAERNIVWFMVAGSALGAVREGDVIPWDDDLDIGLLREDYERLRRAMREDPIRGMFLQDWESEPGFWLFWAKLRLDGTWVDDAEFRETGFHCGIFIDIFPFDRLPSGLMLQRVQRAALGALNLFILPSFYEVHADNPGGARRWAKRAARALARVLPLRWLIRLRERVAQMAGQGQGLLDCFGMFGASRYQRTQTTIAELVPPITGRFGNIAVPLPRLTDAYLRRLYGDYSAPPPVEARRPEHTVEVRLPEPIGGS
jgi:lipopolysaccharide cholinephosphotransferase